MNPTVIIGFDGATFSIIDEHKKSLPTLSRLMEDGYHADLVSTDPPITSVAWPAFVTGQNPGKFGLFDFIGRNPDKLDFHINDTREKDLEFFWDYMQEEIGLASIPMVPYNHNGSFFIQGSLARANEDMITNPASISENIPESYDHHFDWQDDNQSIIESELQRITAREELFKELAKIYEIPLYFFMFQSVDHIQHHFWAYMDEDHPAHKSSNFADVIPKLYERVDEAIANILDVFDVPVNVVVPSDHGFSGIDAKVDMDNLLENNGYMTFTSNGGQNIYQSILSEARDFVFHSFLYEYIPKRVKEVLRDVAGSDPNVANRINWEKTEVYRFGASPNLYINLEGREAQGTVSQDRFESLRHKIIQQIQRIEGVDGQSIVELVAIGEEVYDGPFSYEAPDIVIRPSDGVWLRGNLDDGQVIQEPYKPMPNSGMHSQRGIFIASGPDISPSDGRATEANIIDVAPTILSLFNYQKPVNMDGEVIKDAVSSYRPTTSPERSERTCIRNRVLAMKQLKHI